MTTLRVALAGCVIAGLAFGLPAGEPSDEPPDLWTGKERSDVEAVLGLPDRVQHDPDGSEVLHYKLFRFRDRTEAGAGVALLELPGVGLVGRVVVLSDEKLGIEPSGLDKDGRHVPGGLTRTEEHTIAIGKDKEKKREQDRRDKTKPPVGGRVKLTFRLDADGRIESWSAK